jgi:ABC-type transport system substrate-binding protein
MKLTGWRWFAVSSTLLPTLAAAGTRPQYGGTLRAATHITLASLDPADPSQPDSLARRNLTRLMFDTLVTLDTRGRLEPGLATSWQAEPGNQRWLFRLRRAVRFHDGSYVTPEAVAASLRAANPTWSVLPATDSVVIECAAAAPDLPAELAEARNAIAKRGAEIIVGTGPFRITDWQPGKKLTLAEEDGYWGGRPFLDAIEIEMGKAIRDQLMALDVGRMDVAEVGPEQARRSATAGGRVVSSAPVETLSLVFARDLRSEEEGKLREALALSIDRASIRSVVLQGTGESTAAILPDWISGYAFVFPAKQDLVRARQELGDVRQLAPWTLGYDIGDPLARVIAERIALNARDARLALQTTTSANPDLRLIRMHLASTNARLALAAVAARLGLPVPHPNSNSVDDLYQSENELLRTQRLIPLFHLPARYALSPAVRNWSQDQDGSWHLGDVWLGGAKP